MKFQVFLIYYKRGTGTEVDLRRVAATAQSRAYCFVLIWGMPLTVGALRAYVPSSFAR